MPRKFNVTVTEHGRMVLSMNLRVPEEPEQIRADLGGYTLYVTFEEEEKE